MSLISDLLGEVEDKPAQIAAAASEASYHREEIVAAAEHNVNLLAGLAMPTVFEHEFPAVHLAIWQLLTQSVTNIRSFPKLALGIPRGHGKTTLIKLFILYIVLFTKNKFILVTSDTATKAENIISDVADMLSESNIIRLFGDWRVGTEKNTEAVKKFGFRGRVVILAALGAGGSLRGLNIKNARPDVMIFDDIQSKECSESPVLSANLLNWLVGTAMKAKSPAGCIYIVAGNMFPGDNALLKKLKTNPQWVKFISGAILSDGSALWPALHSKENLLAELDNDIAMGCPEAFFSEVMNDTEVGINHDVDMTKIALWKWGDHERPQGKFIIIDPSGNKANSDATAIGYCEVYDEIPALRELREEVLSPGDTIKRALGMALRHDCRVIIVEGTAYQSTLLYWFEQTCKAVGIVGIQLFDIYGNYASKNSRIRDGIKGLTRGELVIHPDVKSQVAHQIANWNPMKQNNRDNILDLLAYMTPCVKQYGGFMACDEVLDQCATAGVIEDNSCF